MAFTVKDLTDFKRLLVERPEWRAELRQLVLTDELLALPAIVRELAQAQTRTEERLQALEVAVRELTEAQARTEQRVAELAQAQARTEDLLQKLTIKQDKMLGDLLEFRYGRRARALFGRYLRRLRVVLPDGLDAATEDMLEARLAHEEYLEILHLDVLAVGKLRYPPTQEETWLAVEVSSVIDREDVERACRRAELLQKAGLRAVPVVAGEGLTVGATGLLQDRPVVLMLDGRSEGWEKALAAAKKA